jgi:hypothetical protein
LARCAAGWLFDGRKSMAVPKSVLRGLIEDQAKELGNLERQQQATALKLYSDARGDLLGRLDFLEGSAFGLQEFRRTELAVVATVNEFGRGFRAELGRMVKPAGRLAKDHLVQQFKAWGGKVPELPLQKAIDAIRPLVQPQADARVLGYQQALVRDMRGRLALSMMGNEDGDQARGRLVRGYFAPLPEKVLAEVKDAAGADVKSRLSDGIKPNMSAFGEQEPLSVASGLQEWARQVPTTAYWAEKVVTDAVVRTNGAAVVSFLDEAKKDLPTIQKRWISIIDNRTSDICEGLDGESVGIDESFDADGDDVMSPPAHPNCRSSIMAWDPAGVIDF